MNIPKKSIAITLIIVISFITYAAILYSIPITDSNRNHDVANVVLFSDGKETSLIDSLKIDSKAIDLIVITEKNIDDRFDKELLKDTDVVIVDRYLPKKSNDLHLLKSFINGTNSSIGLIFFGGLKNDKNENDDFSDEQINILSDILPVKLDLDYKMSTDDASEEDYKIQIALNEDIDEEKQTDKDNSNILARHIAWTSCPLISKRVMVKMNSDATQIIESIAGDYSIVSEWDLKGGGSVIFYSMVINDYNNPYVLWPYFNYLLYVSIFHVKDGFSDSEIESYGEWPFSPIPHTVDIIVWFSMIGILWIITFYWYFKMRSKTVPEGSEQIESAREADRTNK